MKKYLLLASVAALAFTSCSDQSTEFVGDEVTQKAREISFAPLAKPTTRAAVPGTTFPTAEDLQVAAYMVEPTTQAGNYFSPTTFSYNSTSTYWEGTTPRYWPLSDCFINFLGVANVQGTATFNSTTPTSQCVVVMSDNSSAQEDLMYAIGSGSVTHTGNTLNFSPVSMPFFHAQAWVKFHVAAANTASQDITVNSITLNGARYNGTFTITHTAYDAKTGQTVGGVWDVTSSTTKDQAVPGASATPLTTSGDDFGAGLMIVPDETTGADFTSFTINYSYDGKTYDYTYAPISTDVTKGHSYTYNITFTLHEIQVAASIDADWTNTNTGVTIP